MVMRLRRFTKESWMPTLPCCFPGRAQNQNKLAVNSIEKPVNI